MSGDVKKAVEQRRTEPPGVAIAKSYQGNFAEVLPDHIDAKAFVGSAVASLRKKPDLLAAANNSQTAFVNVLMECAALGHMPGSKEFYLTARRSKDHNNQTVIVGLEGYRGVIERMYRSGAVASVIVREVCQGDKFEFIEGVHDVPVHEVDWFNAERGDPERIIGGYAYARLTSGSTSRVVILSRAEFEAARQASDAGSDKGKGSFGPWKDNYRAMCWKTLAHRLEPWVPTSSEYRREQLRAEAAAGEVRSREGLPAMHADPTTGEVLDDVVDGEVVEDGQGQQQ